MILEIFGMALVDSFLLARKFVSRWQNAEDNDWIFWKYVVALLPQIASSNDGGPTRSLYKCVQVLIGKKKVEHGKSAGRVVAKQQRCVYCIQSKKKKRKNAEDTSSSDNGTPDRARRTAYTCICHKEAFMCKEGVGSCWEQPLKEHQNSEDVGHDSEAEMDLDDSDSDYGS